MEENTGNATDNGDLANDTPQGNPQDRSVPYERFTQVNTAKKAAEDALAAIVGSMVAELPEDMRDLVPNLPPVEKAAWIRSAKERGLFTAPAPASSPDAKRPGGKPTQDFSDLTPLQMLQAGYGKK